MTSLSLQLALHGTVVLLIGLLAGAPYGSSIKKSLKPLETEELAQTEEAVRAWRVAHSGLSSGGICLIAVSAILSDLLLEGPLDIALIVAYIVSGYGFSISLCYGAWTGNRGLQLQGELSNKVVYGGNLLGVLGSLLGTVLLLYACIHTVIVSG